MLSYHSIKLRVISALLVLVFGMTETTYAAPVPVVTPTVIGRLAINNFIDSPSLLEIPLENVMLKEVHKGTSGRLIIHIQDAHANLSGQQNLAKALDHFMTRYDLDLVLVEGSSRDASLHEVRKTGPLDEWKIIARRFLYDGIISGEEYLNLTTEHPMKIMGVEYEDLYDDSIKAYAALVDNRTDILHYLYRAKTAVGRLKQRLYPDTLLRYEASRNKDDSIGYHLGPNFSQLLELAEESGTDVQGFSEVKKLDRLRRSEKAIDFTKANKQQQVLLKELSLKGEDTTVRRFLEDSKRLSNVQISQYLLMRQMLNLARDKSIALQTFPELLVYERYLREFADLELHSLLNELELLEDIVFERMLTNAEAKKVRAIDRFLSLLGNAYKLQMSSKDYSLYEFNEEDFPTESWLAFMNQKLSQLGFFENMLSYKPYLENARENLDKFYTLVGKRDEAFIQNTKRIMSAQHAKAAVLIAGGYHTDNLTELLKKEDASYLVLTPVVTQETDHGKYEDMLLAALREQEGRLLKGEAEEDKFKPKKIMTRKMPRGLRKNGATEYALDSEAARETIYATVANRLGKETADRVVDLLTTAASRLPNDENAPIPVQGPVAIAEPEVKVVDEVITEEIGAVDYKVLMLSDVTAPEVAEENTGVINRLRSILKTGRVQQKRDEENHFNVRYLAGQKDESLQTAAGRLSYIDPPASFFDYLDYLRTSDRPATNEDLPGYNEKSAEVQFFAILFKHILMSSHDIEEYVQQFQRLLLRSRLHRNLSSPSSDTIRFLFEQRSNARFFNYFVERRFQYSTVHNYLRRLHQDSLVEIEKAREDRRDMQFREWMRARVKTAFSNYNSMVKEAQHADLKQGERLAQLPGLRRKVRAIFGIAMERAHHKPIFNYEEVVEYLTEVFFLTRALITEDRGVLEKELLDLAERHLEMLKQIDEEGVAGTQGERLENEIRYYSEAIRNMRDGNTPGLGADELLSATALTDAVDYVNDGQVDLEGLIAAIPTQMNAYTGRLNQFIAQRGEDGEASPLTLADVNRDNQLVDAVNALGNTLFSIFEDDEVVGIERVGEILNDILAEAGVVAERDGQYLLSRIREVITDNIADVEYAHESQLLDEIKQQLAVKIRTYKAAIGEEVDEETLAAEDADAAEEQGGSDASRFAGKEVSWQNSYHLLAEDLALPDAVTTIDKLSPDQVTGTRLALSVAANQAEGVAFEVITPIAVSKKQYVALRLDEKSRKARDAEGNSFDLMTDAEIAREIAGEEIAAAGKTRKIGPELHEALGNLLTRLREAQIQVRFHMSEKIFGNVPALVEASKTFDNRISRRQIAELSTADPFGAEGPRPSTSTEITDVMLYASGDFDDPAFRDKVLQNEITLIVKTAPGTYENPLAAKVIGLAFALFRATHDEIDAEAIGEFLEDNQKLFSAFGFNIDAKTATFMTNLPEGKEAFQLVYKAQIDLNYESLADAIADARLVQQTSDISA